MSELLFARVLLGYAMTRARALRAREDRELGATALEWAVISAIVVTAAVIIGAIVVNIVHKKSTQLEDCGNVDPNSGVTTGCTGGGGATPAG